MLGNLTEYRLNIGFTARIQINKTMSLQIKVGNNMAKEYASGTIAVTTAGTELDLRGEYFAFWSVFPVDGDVTVEIDQGSGYGDVIKGYNGVGAGDELPGRKIRIKAATGTVNVSYYLRGA